jgi:hypothetical protein
MKKVFAILCVAVGLWSCGDGSVELFNGRDLTGWHGYVADPTVDPDTEFKVVDGVIRLGGSLGYLHTRQTFSDYILSVEWRWPEEPSNSGIFQRVQPAYMGLPQCYECQLKAGSAGDLVDLADDRTAETVLDLDKIVIKPKASPSSEKPAGEWNQALIECRGDSIKITVNGVEQNRAGGLRLKSGYVALQSEGGPVEFRNIRIREF